MSGCYLNSSNDGVQWVVDNAQRVYATKRQLLENDYYVCIVNNGTFFAVAVCYSQREIDRFSDEDGREKFWFILDKGVARKHCPQLEMFDPQ